MPSRPIYFSLAGGKKKKKRSKPRDSWFTRARRWSKRHSGKVAAAAGAAAYAGLASNPVGWGALGAAGVAAWFDRNKKESDKVLVAIDELKALRRREGRMAAINKLNTYPVDDKLYNYMYQQARLDDASEEEKYEEEEDEDEKEKGRKKKKKKKKTKSRPRNSWIGKIRRWTERNSGKAAFAASFLANGTFGHTVSFPTLALIGHLSRNTKHSKEVAGVIKRLKKVRKYKGRAAAMKQLGALSLDPTMYQYIYIQAQLDEKSIKGGGKEPEWQTKISQWIDKESITGGKKSNKKKKKSKKKTKSRPRGLVLGWKNVRRKMRRNSGTLAALATAAAGAAATAETAKHSPKAAAVVGTVSGLAMLRNMWTQRNRRWWGTSRFEEIIQQLQDIRRYEGRDAAIHNLNSISDLSNDDWEYVYQQAHLDE